MRLCASQVIQKNRKVQKDATGNRRRCVVGCFKPVFSRPLVFRVKGPLNPKQHPKITYCTRTNGVQNSGITWVHMHSKRTFFASSSHRAFRNSNDLWLGVAGSLDARGRELRMTLDGPVILRRVIATVAITLVIDLNLSYPCLNLRGKAIRMVDRHRSLTQRLSSSTACACGVLLLLLLSVTSPHLADACPYASARACAGSSNASVYLEDGAWAIKEGVLDKADSWAYGRYSSHTHTHTHTQGTHKAQLGNAFMAW